ncbi:hypothetical protein CYMTET_14632, partial [Cymbomonas tetramitiformis]
EYHVDGIPHFVFLDSAGSEKATVIGRLPEDVLQENTMALAEAKETLPFSRATGAVSSLLDGPPPATMKASTDPRAHG